MTIDLRLYAILDPAVAGGHALTALAHMIVGSATLVQLRDKHGGTRAMIDGARALRSVLKPAGVPLLINDRVDVALAAEADGVHIGQDDMSPQDARRLLGRSAIIGLSLSSVRHAHEAPLDLIDYVGIGAVYQTGSKDDASTPIGVSGLREIAGAVRARQPGFPICAISGINATNAAETVVAGADGVAVISALSGAPDPTQAARALRAVVDAARKRRGGLA